MGFFSSKCEVCDHPALSRYATSPINEWMEHVVTINENGTMIVGIYDGYGSVGDNEMALGFGQTVYHWACWKSVGSPTAYKGESGYAEDQGYFFDEGDHDFREPRIPHKSR